MTTYEIPLTPQPQTFGIQLGGATYRLTVVWNVQTACWMLAIAQQNGTPILSSVPIVTGRNLLESFAYLGIGSLYASTDGDLNAVPTYSNLGTAGHLYFTPAAT